MAIVRNSFERASLQIRGKSKLERLLEARIAERFPDLVVEQNRRPEWLATDAGQRLELDFYFPELNLAIEVQGQQHYVYTPHFHKSFDEFLAQKQRDESKSSICATADVELLECFDKDSVDAAIDRVGSAYRQLMCIPKTTQSGARYVLNQVQGIRPGPMTARVEAKIARAIRCCEAHNFLLANFDFLANPPDDIKAAIRQLMSAAERSLASNGKRRQMWANAILHGCKAARLKRRHVRLIVRIAGFRGVGSTLDESRRFRKWLRGQKSWAQLQKRLGGSPPPELRNLLISQVGYDIGISAIPPRNTVFDAVVDSPFVVKSPKLQALEVLRGAA